MQPFWKAGEAGEARRRQALGTLLLARALSRLVLYPFSEVQHYMPEHITNAEELEGILVGERLNLVG